ncbi:hypothetical protein ACM71K_30300 [Pseudomonas aeruginosa]
MTTDTDTPRHWHEDSHVWRFICVRYLIVLASFNLLWEIAQLPLYTLWAEAPPSAIAYAVLHCTLGDILIGVLALLAALIATRAGPLERWRWWRIGGTAVGFGLAYTALSEWLNTTVLMSWAYSEWMPLTPILALGISPLLQWLVVPVAALVWARGTTRKTNRA